MKVPTLIQRGFWGCCNFDSLVVVVMIGTSYWCFVAAIFWEDAVVCVIFAKRTRTGDRDLSLERFLGRCVITDVGVTLV